MLIMAIVALVCLLVVINTDTEKTATRRANAEAQAARAEADRAASQADLERARWEGQAQLALTQAQADNLRVNSNLPTIALVVGGVIAVVSPLSMLGAALLLRRKPQQEQPVPARQVQISPPSPADPALLLPAPFEERQAYWRRVERAMTIVTPRD